MPDPTATDVTEILARWRDGDAQALEELLPEVYGELRRLASRHLRGERSGHTLETHDLIHEAFLRLIELRRIDWRDREHFFAVAARMMRRILVDHARRRSREKRGGGIARVALEDAPMVSPEGAGEILAVDAALRELDAFDPELGRIVELRFFGGFKHEEVAALFGHSKTTARRRWRLAKAWLYRHLTVEEDDGPGTVATDR